MKKVDKQTYKGDEKKRWTRWKRCQWRIEEEQEEVKEEDKEHRINAQIKETMKKGLKCWCNKKTRDLIRRWKVCKRRVEWKLKEWMFKRTEGKNSYERNWRKEREKLRGMASLEMVFNRYNLGQRVSERWRLIKEGKEKLIIQADKIMEYLLTDEIAFN